MKEQGLYLKAIETWGIEAQRMVFHEEMAELLEIENCKNPVGFIGELADAVIMTEQMVEFYGIVPAFNMDSLIGLTLSGSYYATSIAMSHYNRGRCDIDELGKQFNNLHAVLHLQITTRKLCVDEFIATHKKKLHRLADMLGETYEESEA